MPGVQVHANDGALAKPRGEARLVTLVVEKPWGEGGGAVGWGEPGCLGGPPSPACPRGTTHLCRRGPSCPHPCQADCRTCGGTCPGPHLMCRCPPSRKKEQGGQGLSWAPGVLPTTPPPATAYHVSAVDRRGHLDLPEVLALPQLLGAPDGRGATAVLHVEVDLPVVTAQQSGRRLIQVIPYPVKICRSEGQAVAARPGPSPVPSPGPQVLTLVLLAAAAVLVLAPVHHVQAAAQGGLALAVTVTEGLPSHRHGAGDGRRQGRGLGVGVRVTVLGQKDWLSRPGVPSTLCPPPSALHPEVSHLWVNRTDALRTGPELPWVSCARPAPTLLSATLGPWTPPGSGVRGSAPSPHSHAVTGAPLTASQEGPPASSFSGQPEARSPGPSLLLTPGGQPGSGRAPAGAPQHGRARAPVLDRGPPVIHAMGGSDPPPTGPWSPLVLCGHLELRL